MGNKLFEFDKYKSKKGLIIGTDEAGRGPGAGDVYAAAVCFKDVSNNLIKKLSKLNDSKQLTEKVREELFDIITENSIYSIKAGSVQDIEKFNILEVSLASMKNAVNEVLLNIPDNVSCHVLVDGRQLIKNYNYSQEFIIKGDSKSASIAAASILAKVSRDRYMNQVHEEFPQYNFKQNKGYLTKEHIEAIDKYGLCPYHRQSFLKKHFEKQKQMQLQLF